VPHFDRGGHEFVIIQVDEDRHQVDGGAHTNSPSMRAPRAIGIPSDFTEAEYSADVLRDRISSVGWDRGCRCWAGATAARTRTAVAGTASAQESEAQKYFAKTRVCRGPTSDPRVSRACPGPFDVCRSRVVVWRLCFVV
jgi:hypothetical protein